MCCCYRLVAMDSGVVSRRVTSGRRVRPGSMIAARLQVFEAAEPAGECGLPASSLCKAKSMGDLLHGDGGWGQSVTTPTPSAVPVRCNPSTGQALPLVLSSSSLLQCVRAVTQGSTPKPRPQPTPPLVWPAHRALIRTTALACN